MLSIKTTDSTGDEFISTVFYVEIIMFYSPITDLLLLNTSEPFAELCEPGMTNRLDICAEHCLNS